jgi:hypothetical protein
MKLSRPKLKLLRRGNTKVTNSYSEVTDDVFRTSQTAFTDKLEFLKEDLAKDFIAKIENR